MQCLYTSGTTSRPKGVLVSHTSLVTSLLSNAPVTRQSRGPNSPVMLVVLPMFHVTALNTVTMPVLMMGGTAVPGTDGLRPRRQPRPHRAPPGDAHDDAADDAPRLRRRAAAAAA
uniref:Acyl--CoA ligase n=1 Tax=Janibacter limosus TaxID=53458 RepID=A0AC61U746_9MICO